MRLVTRHWDFPRLTRLAKEGSWILAGQVASVLGSLVLVRVLTEYLEPEQYGQLALGMTISGLVGQVVMGGVANGISRYYSISAEQNDLAGYQFASIRLMGYATAVVAAIAMMLLAGMLWLDYTQWMALVTAALVLSVFSGYNGCLSGIQNAARQRGIVAFHAGMDAWLKIPLAVGAMLWLGTSSTAVVLGYVMSSLLVTGSQLLFLRRLIRPKAHRPQAAANWEAKIWAFSWPFSIWGVFTWMQQASDRWALQSFTSTEDIGLYTAIFQLGYAPIGMVTTMALAFLGPILYQRSGSATDSARNASTHHIVWRITFVCLLVTGFAFVVTYALHEWIVSLLVAKQYRSVSYLLPWVIVAGGIFAAGQMLSIKLAAEMRPASMITVKIVTALLGLGLNFYGAAKFGVHGVVAGLVGFAAIYFLWMAWLAHHLPASPNLSPKISMS